MDKRQAIEIAKKYKDMVAEHLPLKALYLFGSYSKGGYTEESDIDIAIIIKNEMDNQTKKRFISWAADMDMRYERIFSIVDIQEGNMKKWERVLPFYQNIRREGIVLWRAA